MKTMLFTAALMIGTAAIAQNTGTTEQERTNTNVQSHSGQHKTHTTTTAKKPAASGAGEGVTAEGTVPSGVASAPPGTNVVATPSGGGVVVAPNQGSMFATQPADRDYPRCSRTVTDNCRQGGPR